MTRLFVAVALNEAVKRSLLGVQEQMAAARQSVRWVGEAQMHLTLKFLGEVGDGQVSSLCAALATAAGDSRRFEFGLTAAGCFPRRGTARVIWVGVDEPSGRLQACHAGVEERLAEAGWPKEPRPFAAHLTIGRVRRESDGSGIREALARVRVRAARQQATALELVQSELLPQGPRYVRLGHWLLPTAGANAP